MNPSGHAWWDFGYLGIIGCVFVEQIGLPIPAFPALLAAGTLAATGQLNPALCLLSAMGAAMAADSIWYRIGQVKGGKILNFMCKLAWRPDSCVGKTKTSFFKLGTKTLLFSKFIPGLNTLAAPLAGVARVPYYRFLLYDGAGALLWASVPLAAGAYLRESLKAMGGRLHAVETDLFWIFGTLVVVVLAWHFFNRRRYLNELRKSLKNGISSEELNRLMNESDDVVILDIRDKISAQAHPVTLPKARWVPYNAVVERISELPLEKVVVVFCDCPADQAAGGMVNLLHKVGAKRVRPLLGGLHGWTSKGFATVELTFETDPTGGTILLQPSAS